LVLYVHFQLIRKDIKAARIIARHA
jgi:hypothetical protein